MCHEPYRSTLRVLVGPCVIVIALLFLLTNAVAGPLQTEDVNRASGSSNPSGTGSTKSLGSDQAVTVTQTDESGSQQQGANSKQPASTSVTPTPLTPRQKFNYFARSSFWSPTSYGFSVLSGVFSEATDNDHHRHMTSGDFMADSMTHAARSMAFRITANFFEKFAFASAFKQDPRYFRSDKKGFGRIGYAVSHVFITKSDSGHDQVNASFLAGGLVTAGISNAWSRPEDRTLTSTMSRFGFHVGYRALSNILKELFGKR
jgi:hypothetical protein